MPRGHLVIIGGGTIPNEVRSRALQLSGGARSHVLIIPAASASPENASREVAEKLRALGAADCEVNDLSRVDDAVSAVLRADLIWFTGGDQSRIIRAMAGPGSPIAEAIRRRYLEGATIAGSSAGAAVMSGLMMTGGSDLDTIRNGTTQLSDGLGLWNDVIIDQHFLKRGRFNRLAGAVLDHPDLLGIGIDEATAVVVSGREFEVTGQSNVIVVDGRPCKKSRSAQGPPPHAGDPASGVNMSLHILKAGMKYHLDKGVVGTGDAAQGGGQ
ncbi:MAG: cyanophycinase [Isosphaeraceae bacterium]